MAKPKQPEDWTPSFHNRRGRRRSILFEVPVFAEVTPPEATTAVLQAGADAEPGTSSDARPFTEAEIGEVLFVDPRSGRNVRRTNDKSNTGAVHSGFEPMESKDILNPYVDN